MDIDEWKGIRFHPLIKRWFKARIGPPTPIQRKAWPLIAAGTHVLITAPTGSGKTLAAFLWALDRLIRRRWEPGQARVLYVSPLKALNNDVRRNLMRPLAEIRRLFAENRVSFPDIRVATRSGDTPSHERRQMIRRPPEILITTPESLHLILSSLGGRSMLTCVTTVILDEIHAVAGNKRGTLLMSAVDRLVPLCGEFQRIALSATVNPARPVADFVAGFMRCGDSADPTYSPRPITICRSTRHRQDLIRVRIAGALATADGSRNIWEELSAAARQIIASHRATIIFTNSRRLCEKLTFLINAENSGPVAYAHHGSLSRQLRLEVEQRLKKGDLKAIVATASLELGIDIGALDHVILVSSPTSISSALQRIGRSGHAVGEPSRATFFPTDAGSCLTAAVLAEAVMAGDIEPVRPVQCPLDVLAQVVVSMAGVETWHTDALYHALRTSYPFRRLKRRAFDLVVAMLAGRYAATRLPGLQPKIALDRLDNTLTARKGALLTLYASGGVIPDRGYYNLRHQESGARIGELDEEFVWEARKGQVFTLGTQNWRIQRITPNDVFVRPARPRAPVPPFWKAEAISRDFYLSDRIARFLESAQQRLGDPRFVDQLSTRHGLDAQGARFLVEFLRRQREKTGCALPHRHHVVLETTRSDKGGSAVRQLVMHTFWGGRVNRPFALALEAAWEKRHGHAPSTFTTNDAIYVLLPGDRPPAGIMTLVTPDNIEALLRERLEGAGVFGARFRECAARALLLPRRHFNQRMPLWLIRQQSQRLLEALGRFPDFPILLETWRTCLEDDFDTVALAQVLRELENGDIDWSAVRTPSPSPMALTGSWRQVNQYMYADDQPRGKAKTELAADLLEEVIFKPEWRPAVDAALVADYQEKRQRLHPGYAPDGPTGLLEWVKERLLVPMVEWRRLLACAARDSGMTEDELLGPIGDKLIRLIPGTTGEAAPGLIVAVEMASLIRDSLYAGRRDIRCVALSGAPCSIKTLPLANADDALPTAGEMLAQWLGFYGPLTIDDLYRCLGLDTAVLAGMLADLIETRTVIAGMLIREQRQERICMAENFDTLLRMARRRRVPTLEPRGIRELAWALAHYQGVTRRGETADDLAACLRPLLGLALPAVLWESEILPARLTRYDPQRLDRLLQASALMWVGRPPRNVCFCHEDDLDLITAGPGDAPADSRDDEANAPAARALFPDSRGRYSLSDLLGDPPRAPNQVIEALWAGVWAGRVTNDSMLALRQAIANQFESRPSSHDALTAVHASLARRRYHKRRASAALASGMVGNWRWVIRPQPPEGLLEKEELVKDRVRLLLDRYGILFRRLLRRESPLFQWSAVFRALRLMELSGEVVAGCFFDDISGPQFVSKRMLRMLRQKIPADTLFWINAQDPACICGLGIDALKDKLPRRSTGTHLVYLGSRLAMISRRHGRVLDIRLPADHPRLADCFNVFEHLLDRPIAPRRSITVETVNAEAAAGSPLVEVLRQRFDILVETGSITVYRRMGA